ncbi:MAG: hypothetical protein MUF64_01870 [Polyangiaceae bacterium]|jgi:hypothetical protein|nr:hypothetical protein [Polyangiaceae bacterium]
MLPPFEPLPWVRWLGLWVALAALLGRGLVPGLQGLAPERVILVLSVVGGLLSQGLLLALVASLVRLTSVLLRVPALPLAYRMGVTALGGLVLGLATPASMTRLSPVFSGVLALVVALTALAGAAQALQVRGARVLGLLLALAAVGALTRQTSQTLLLAGGAGALRQVALAGVWVGLGALLVQGVLVLVGLLWLSTRRSRWLAVLTPVCSAAAMGVAWLADLALNQQLSSWRAVLARAAQQYLVAPSLPVPVGLRVFLSVSSLLLGVLALTHRREPPAVVGSFALLMIAGLDLDVPLCALSVAVGALVATLAAHDPETHRHPVRYDLQG